MADGDNPGAGADNDRTEHEVGVFSPELAVTGIGSLPHTEPADALADVLHFNPECPYWPQLPRRSRQEDMYRQFSAGLPGLRFDPGVSGSATVLWRRDEIASRRLEQVYEDALRADEAVDNWAVAHEAAAGLYALDQALAGWRDIEGGAGGLIGLKGQITGPISLGLAVTDEDGRALLYEEDLMDGVVRALALRARWQEGFLTRLACRVAPAGANPPRVLVSVDEPYLGTFGSAYFPYRPETVLGYLEILATGFRGVWGVHCCANTDWEFMMASPARFLSFDAYAYADRVVLYPEAIRRYLRGGNALVWGIVPTTSEALAAEDERRLTRRLLGHFETLVARGVPEQALVRQSMISPACGLAGLSVEDARRAMSLAGTVADAVRQEVSGPADRGRKPNLGGWR